MTPLISFRKDGNYFGSMQMVVALFRAPADDAGQILPLEGLAVRALGQLGRLPHSFLAREYLQCVRRSYGIRWLGG
jgi:hypothetical protein